MLFKDAEKQHVTHDGITIALIPTPREWLSNGYGVVIRCEARGEYFTWPCTEKAAAEKAYHNAINELTRT